jgi:hypothetical protein
MAVDRNAWPLLVQLALWGLPSQRAAWAFFWLSIAIAVACVAYGFIDYRFFIGGIMAVAALWYYLAIRWVDQNSSWS